MSKTTINAVGMGWAKSCIEEAIDRIKNLKQSPDDVQKYLLDWLDEMDFDVEIDELFVNDNGYLIASVEESHD